MRIWRKNFRCLKNSNYMVAEVVGAILLLAMTIAFFSVLYIAVLSNPTVTSQSTAKIVGTVEASTISGGRIILEHRGGESLDLDSKVTITINGTPTEITVGDFLDDSNRDNLWNVGEIAFYPFVYTTSYTEADVITVNVDGNEIVLMGTLDINPECDLGIKITVDNPYPYKYQNIVFTIKVANYRSDLTVPDVKVNFTIPVGMIYVSQTPSAGNYDNSTGFWDVGSLAFGESATIDIVVTVISGTERTQLAVLLDGSGSISKSDWNIMLGGLAKAIVDGNIPHNGFVELTVIQFGGWTGGNPGVNGGRSWAQVELGGPIVLTGTNYNTVATQIQGIVQLGGGTAMSCAFRLAADVMSGDPNNKLTGTYYAGMASTHSDWPRQVINLVTDGQPNIIYLDTERYKGWWPGSNAHPNEYTQGKTNTEAALAYYESLIPIEQGDEIDSEAVGTDTDIPWLRDHVVRPGHYDTWPPVGPGWVCHVEGYQEFADTIGELFDFIFKEIPLTATVSSDIIDPNLLNNQFSVTVIPQ